MYLHFSASFVLTDVFILIISIFFFQFKKLPLAYFVRLVWWWWNLSDFVCKIKYSPSFLKNSFVGYNILGWQFVFSFGTLNVSFYCLPACKLYPEKSSASSVGTPLYIFYCFSLSAFRTFSLCMIFESSIIICCGVVLFRWNLFGILWPSYT